jgi:ATP-dependent Clp protease ATP-binding subunit ClpC
MFERYSERARRVIFFANSEASERGSLSIEPEHMLLGLLRADERFTNHFLSSAKSVESIRKQIEEHTPLREKTTTGLPLSDECRKIILFTAEEAERLGSKEIGTEHLLLGILRKEDSLAARLLKGHGLRFDAIFKELAHLSEERERQANRVLKIPNLGHMKPGRQNE